MLYLVIKKMKQKFMHYFISKNKTQSLHKNNSEESELDLAWHDEEMKLLLSTLLLLSYNFVGIDL